MTNTMNQFILELDDHRYQLKGNKLVILGETDPVDGDKWIISDFEGAAPDVITVDSPMRYVDAVIEKRLREKGALVGGGRVLILRKHRRGSRATEAYYVAVPAALYAKYASAAVDDESHQLVFPLHGLLARGLGDLRTRKSAAILLVHDRHVDILVGDNHRTYGAFRASWHRSGEDKSKLIENITNGLRGIEHENNIRINKLHSHYWLVEQPKDTAWMRKISSDLDVTMVQPKFKKLIHQGKNFYSSVPTLLKKLSATDSISTPGQKYGYRAQQLMPWAAAAMIVISLGAAAATLYWKDQARNFMVESAIIQGSLTLPEPGPAVLKAAYEKPLELANTLGRAQISPSIQNLLAELSASVSNKLTFDEIAVNYPDDKSHIELTLVGQSEKPEDDDGVATFNIFLSALRQRGYTLVNSELKTDVNNFYFLVRLERSLK